MMLETEADRRLKALELDMLETRASINRLAVAQKILGDSICELESELEPNLEITVQPTKVEPRLTVNFPELPIRVVASEGPTPLTLPPFFYGFIAVVTGGLALSVLSVLWFLLHRGK